MKWSAFEDEVLMDHWLRKSASVLEIADEMDRSKSAVHRRITALGLKGEKGNVRLYNELSNRAANPHLQAVRFVDLPKVTPPKPTAAPELSLHYSDVHFPFEDKRAVDILYQIIEEYCPDTIVCHGDLADFYQLSPYRPPDMRRLGADQIDLQGTIDATAAHLATVRQLVPTAEIYYLYGNHEDRWEKMMLELASKPRLRHLMQLDAIAEVLDLDYLLGVEELGIETRRYYESEPLLLNDHILCTHGYTTNKWNARSTMEKYGKSVMFGHDHRVQNFVRRDLRGTDAGWGIGCLCDLTPHYTAFPDWHQGFALIHWAPDNQSFDVHQLRIHDGIATFDGKVYRGYE